MGIHPGLHADGVFEFWEPTLDLLLEENIVTVFTMFSQEEYEMSLVRLDGMFAKYVEINLPNCLQVCVRCSFSPRYLFKGKNSLGSTHVKQTPHNPDMMWASNTYLIVFQGRLVFLIKVQIGDKLLQDG